MNTPISSGFRDAMPFQYPWTPRSHGRSLSGGKCVAIGPGKPCPARRWISCGS